MPFIHTQDRPADPTPDIKRPIGARFLSWYHWLAAHYDKRIARRRVHNAVESERSKQWTEEHGRRGRR